MATDSKLTKLDYFCENSMYRYIEQVVRAFSGWQYKSYPGGVETLNVVPCLPNQTDLLVATILSKASDTTAATVPMISVTHTGVEFRREDVQCLTHISHLQVAEREIVDGKYTGKEGRTYMVERLMPRPFAMTFDIDVWTSNKDQKYQLLEQMLTVFAPSIQIQNSESVLDWAAFTSMDLEGIEYSSQAGPVGTDGNRIDYFTLKMRIPIWLNPPARVSQRRRIEQIVTNIYDGKTDFLGVAEGVIQGDKLAQVIVTTGDHCIGVRGSVITLLSSHGGINDEKGNIFDWAELVKVFGNLRPGTSTIHLSTTGNIEATDSDITGTINYDPNNYNVMTFTLNPQSMPADTLAPVTAVINPRTVFPGQGLDSSTIGERYLLTKSITGPTVGWGTLSAQAYDIIQFDGSHWTVAYRPVEGPHFVADHVTNTHSGRQLRWTGAIWDFTFDGIYQPGYWRIHL